MCVDLNRCLYYSDARGAHFDAPEPVRTVLTVIDGVIAGEGEGPLAPSDVPLGVVLAATDPVALDLAAVRLMGFDEAPPAQAVGADARHRPAHHGGAVARGRRGLRGRPERLRRDAPRARRADAHDGPSRRIPAGAATSSGVAREADRADSRIGLARAARGAGARAGARPGDRAQRLLGRVAGDREDGARLRPQVAAGQGAQPARPRAPGDAQAAPGRPAAHLSGRAQPARCTAAARLLLRGRGRGRRAGRRRLRAGRPRRLRGRGLRESRRDRVGAREPVRRTSRRASRSSRPPSRRSARSRSRGSASRARRSARSAP